MSNFNTLLSALKQGGARANLFEVTLTPPGGEAVDLFVRSASIPAATDGEILLPFKGRQLKIPGDRTYDSWEVTVLCDASYASRKAFEAWKTSLNDHESGLAAQAEIAPSMVDITVVHQDRAGAAIATYVLHDAWCQVLGSIELAHESADTIATFSATIAYQYYTTK